MPSLGDLEVICTRVPELRTKCIEEDALTYQFLEWLVSNSVASDSSQKYEKLQELDRMLESISYMSGHRLTAIDILVARKIHRELGDQLFDPKGKVFLAPMVRVSTHPMRLLALKYGADYVFTEELIDHRVLKSRRLVNCKSQFVRTNPLLDELDTVDFVLPDGSITFRTSYEEKGAVFAQLGTPDAVRALQAAKLLEQDVSGIDVNMGCPKDYSVKGGMGAALLTQSEKVREILTTLVSGLKVPVTCKIRILPKLEDTLTLAKLIESTGVSALTVHGRTPHERPQHRNRNEVIRAIAQAVSIPVIANGGSRDIIRIYDDIEFFRQETGASAVMIARAAMWNPSIFSAVYGNVLPPDLHNIIREYLTLAVRYDHHIVGAKYCVLQMLHEQGDTPVYQDVLAAVDLRSLCASWDSVDIYERELAARLQRLNKGESFSDTVNSEPKRMRMDENSVVLNQNHEKTIERSLPYDRKLWPRVGSGPRQILSEHCKKNKLPAPKYETTENHDARLFYSSVTVDGIQYRNSSGCRSKKYAEQAAALLCIHMLGLSDGRLTTCI